MTRDSEESVAKKPEPGRPWTIVAVFPEYTQADLMRTHLLENGDVEVKVKITLDGFTVRTRKIQNTRSSTRAKDDQPRKTRAKDRRRRERERARDSADR